MKVYLATSGEYSDYRVEHVFTRREDAESYEGADNVTEYEVRESPVEMRHWHTLLWRPDIPDREGDSLRNPNPYEWSTAKDYDGHPQYAAHQWAGPPSRTGPVLQVEGWSLQRVRKVYSEQRAQFIAGRAAIP